MLHIFAYMLWLSPHSAVHFLAKSKYAEVLLSMELVVQSLQKIMLRHS